MKMRRTFAYAKYLAILFLAVATTTSNAASIIDSESNDNDSPIIGVLTQEIAYSLDKIYPGEYKSFIAASYVKFVEGGGGRVVPVW